MLLTLSQLQYMIELNTHVTVSPMGFAKFYMSVKRD